MVALGKKLAFWKNIHTCLNQHTLNLWDKSLQSFTENVEKTLAFPSRWQIIDDRNNLLISIIRWVAQRIKIQSVRDNILVEHLDQHQKDQRQLSKFLHIGLTHYKSFHNFLFCSECSSRWCHCYSPSTIRPNKCSKYSIRQNSHFIGIVWSCKCKHRNTNLEEATIPGSATIYTR